MMHDKRRFTVKAVENPAVLARLLTQHTWCGCNGFAYGGCLFLNDSFSADGAQEYAVINLVTGEQIESVTFSWMAEAAAWDFLENILPEAIADPPMRVAFTPRIETYQEHRNHGCGLCA